MIGKHLINGFLKTILQVKSNIATSQKLLFNMKNMISDQFSLYIKNCISKIKIDFNVDF